MPVDLKTNNGYSNVSLLVTDDALVVLEHELRSDRVRKIPHDRIESLQVWSKLPIAWIVVLTIVFVLPSMSLFFVRETGATVVGLFLLACSGSIVAVLAYCRRTTIRIVCDGTPQDFPTLTRPGKINRFVDKLRRAIEKAQKLAEEKALADAVKAQAESPQNVLEDALAQAPETPAAPDSIGENRATEAALPDFGDNEPPQA